MQIESEIMKFLAVAGSAGFSGVMLTIGLGLVPFFYLAGPTDFEAWFASYFFFLVRAVFITSIPALIGSIALIRRSLKGTSERIMWRNTLLALVLVYGITTVIHLPLNISFWSMTLSGGQIVTNLNYWTLAHVLRIIAALFASYSAFKALSTEKTKKKNWARITFKQSIADTASKLESQPEISRSRWLTEDLRRDA